jgi:hypothetical protein
MNCYIFDIHLNCCFVADDLVEDEYKYDLLEVGPLNMIRSDVLKRVKTAVRSISSSPVPLNWCSVTTRGKCNIPHLWILIKYPPNTDTSEKIAPQYQPIFNKFMWMVGKYPTNTYRKLFL